MAGIGSKACGWDVVVVKDAGNVPLTAVAKTATFVSAAINIPEASFLGVQVLVASVTGTSPTLDVSLQVSFNGTNWATLQDAQSSFSGQGVIALDQLTAAGSSFMQCMFGGVYLRLNFVLGGTSPSFTITGRVMIKNNL